MTIFSIWNIGNLQQIRIIEYFFKKIDRQKREPHFWFSFSYSNNNFYTFVLKLLISPQILHNEKIFIQK